MARFLTLIVMASWAACASGQERRDVDWFVRGLIRHDRLPSLEASRTYLESTWDRSGGNEDGDDFKDIKGDRNILLDVSGPGCVHRISTGLLGDAVAGTRIRVFLDGAEAPTLDRPVEAFFDGDRLSGGFLGKGEPGHYPSVIAPIPFAGACRIELHSESDHPRWGRYWQIVWTRYADDSLVSTDPSFKALLDPAFLPCDEHDLMSETYRSVVHGDYVRIAAGASGGIRIEGSGTLRLLSLGTMLHRDSSIERTAVLRAIRVKIYWDGSEHASVDVPLGYLAGSGDGIGEDVWKKHIPSQIIGPSHIGIDSLRLPMPFRKGALVEFENGGTEEVRVSHAIEVDRRPVPQSNGYLHATWREERAGSADAPVVGPRRVPVHVALDRRARGKYVGLIKHVEWPFRGWWGEGDALIWIDDDPAFPPSYHGTGTEEYFNSAWCKFDRTPLAGAIRERPGDVVLYSFHKNDAFNFQRRIKVAFERVGQGPADDLIRKYRPIWGTTAFWYADRPLPAGSTKEPLPRRAHPPLIDEWNGGLEPVQSGGTMRFTTDGSEPTKESPEWESGSSFPGKLLRARAFHPHRLPSDVVHVRFPGTENPLPSSDPNDLEPGSSWAVFDGDFEELPETAKLEPVLTGTKETRDLIGKHVVARGGLGVAVRTRSFLKVAETGPYLFDINGAEHARLTLDGRVLVGPGIDRSSSWPPCALVALEAGAHEVIIESLVHPKIDRLALHVTTPDGTRRPVNLQREKR